MKRHALVFITCFTLGLIACETLWAANRIDIAPRRVILEPRERGGEVTLLNLSDKEGTFRIEIINYAQDENGTYNRLTGPLNPVFDPEQALRMSPRQFTLPPDGRQKVRFSIKKPADLPDGEYRFHLLATRMSDFGPPAPVEEGEKAVGMTTNIATAIPVIVRHGEVQVTARMSDGQYVPANTEGKPEMQVTLHRDGNISTIGSLKVYWTPQGGQTIDVGGLTNFNIFTEIDKRYAKIPLKTALTGSGTIQIVYIQDETQQPYAETTIQR